MFIRTTTVKRDNKQYQYAQLVDSVRRESDGMPVHHVIAHLGNCTPLQIENLRMALRASREGKKVVIPAWPTTTKGKAKPTTLRYLDIAVLLELWRKWGLDSLIKQLIPDGNSKISPAAIVAALTLQACISPGSELSATQWFPYTALPELLGIPLKAFNNTRLHRVLDQLENAESALMRQLPRLIAKRARTTPAFAAFFLDVTDAWYVGHGPSLAKKGKTKEGLVKRKIGIVLLCDDSGFPLRWDVVEGSLYDGDVMTQMFESMSGLSWVEETPVVCDRAMGKTAYLHKMLATDVRFLTAMTRSEFSTYAPKLPWERLSKLNPSGPENRDTDVKMAAKCAQEVGLQKVADNVFVIDLKTLPLDQDEPAMMASQRGGDDLTIEAMRLCREITQDVEDGRYASFAAAGRVRGIDKGLVTKYRKLSLLPQDVQQDILDGKATGYAIATLIAIAKVKGADEQRSAFAALIDTPPQRRPRASSPATKAAVPTPAEQDKQKHGEGKKVRVVAYFNPELFVDRRLLATRRQKNIRQFVEGLNKQLASPRSKKTRDKIAAAVDSELRKYDLIEAFKVSIFKSDIDGRECYQVRVDLDAYEWAKRRRYDGFSVLVAHPSLSQSAEELCRLYRAKDTVEKDFGVIKGLLDVRPLAHQNNEKVRAHVTLRMLGLLLERTLHKRLMGRYTARQALQHLKHCTVDYYKGKGEWSIYGVSEANEHHLAILRTLRLQHLTDDREFDDMITPR